MNPMARTGTPMVGDSMPPRRRFQRQAPVRSATSAGFEPLPSIDERDEDAVLDAVRGVRAGNEAALDYLYVRFSGNVYAYVKTIMHDDHEAEDVTQQVFLKLRTCIHQYTSTGVPFFAWILRVARNLAYDSLRARRATPVDSVFAPDERAPEGRLAATEIRDALAALPDEQREVVLLRHLVGLTPVEIAGRLGKTEASIHGLHHRGRGALKAELARCGAVPSARPARRKPVAS